MLLIKLDLIMFHDCLSDAQVWLRVETDLAYLLQQPVHGCNCSLNHGKP